MEFTKQMLRHNVLVVTTGCAAHSLGKAGILSTEGLGGYFLAHGVDVHVGCRLPSAAPGS